jgi:hypothetical protein
VLQAARKFTSVSPDLGNGFNYVLAPQVSLTFLCNLRSVKVSLTLHRFYVTDVALRWGLTWHRRQAHMAGEGNSAVVTHAHTHTHREERDRQSKSNASRVKTRKSGIHRAELMAIPAFFSFFGCLLSQPKHLAPATPAAFPLLCFSSVGFCAMWCFAGRLLDSRFFCGRDLIFSAWNSDDGWQIWTWRLHPKSWHMEFHNYD